MKRELRIFFNRNKWFLIIALVCIWVTVKQMNAPFALPYNAVTSFLFERVPDDTTWGEVLDLLNNLGFAFYSSLIFYYVVDYFPTRKKEIVAFHAVEDHLSEIIIHIEKLFAVLLLVSGKGTKIDDLKGRNVIPSLCGLEFDSDTLRYNWEVTNVRTREIHEGAQGEILCPLDFVKTESKAIINEITEVFSHANAEMLEEEIKELLCLLNENRYLVNASRADSNLLDRGRNVFVINCCPDDLLTLLGVRLVLGKLPIEQYRCTVCLTTEEEIAEIEERYAKLRETFPNEVAAFEKTRKRTQKAATKVMVTPRRKKK